MAPLSPNMIAALRLAAERSDGSIDADRRTRDALIRRGLVDVRRGRGTGYVYQGPFRRSLEYTTYNVITGVYINGAGRKALGCTKADKP